MKISEKLVILRKRKGYSQEGLANELDVSRQAVYKWETESSTPDMSNLKKIAKLFDISFDRLLDDDIDISIEENNINQSEKELDDDKIKEIARQVVKETANKVQFPEQKPVLTICDRCKKPVYKSEDIISKTGHKNMHSYKYYICNDCDKKETKEKKEQAILHGISQRNKSYWWGGIFALLVMFLGISAKEEFGSILILTILTFTFLSCMFLKNNFIEDIFINVVSWGFVKFPGLIFTFDLNGFLWLIGMKILFWLIGMALGILALILALIICIPLSVIVYPFALIKNIKNPEFTENI